MFYKQLACAIGTRNKCCNNLLYWYIFKDLFIFAGKPDRQRGRETDKKIFHPLPGPMLNQSEARVSHMGACGWEAGLPGPELALTWDPGMCKASL